MKIRGAISTKVLIYFTSVPVELSAETEAKILSGLPRFRREKAERYARQSDRLLSAAVWYLLRYAVRELCGVDCFALNVGADAKRKPFFEGFDGMHFNVSHCRGREDNILLSESGGAAVCAVDSALCGIDIELLRTAKPEVAKRVMPAKYDELMRLAPGRERDELFTRAWTEAESVYKAGVSENGELPEGYGVYRFEKDGCYIALCAKRREAGFELKEVGFEEITRY